MSSPPTDQHEAGSSASRPGPAIQMPQMGVSVAEGTIVEWLKQPGDWVEADETVAVVTTDKVDVEIPAPASGRLEEILVEVDETVAVGTLLASIDAGASPGVAHPEEQAEEPATAPPANGEPDRSQFYSPVVRRVADEHGVDLEAVEGTGIGGRVRKSDVLALVESGRGQAERPLHSESPYVPEESAASTPVPAASNGVPADGVRREPMSPMRRAIAEHMVESRRTAAHCTTVVRADMSRVMATRKEFREPMTRRGVKLTPLAFVAAAAVEALQRHPELNASVDGDELVLHDSVHLGIAVALEKGLIVPVIRDAQRLGLEGLAAEIGDLAGRARSGDLAPDDVTGGTFTITNPGQFGAVLATPIINQPQVAILDLEAIVKTPVVVESDEGDSIAIRPITNLCMSWDHRALDGAQAARFLSDVKERLEGWGR